MSRPAAMDHARRPGPAAVAAKGRLAANKWLLLRRVSQLGFLALFLAGPVAGWWIVEGTLAASLTLGVLPLTDPFITLQSLVAGHVPEATALLGAVIVAAAYGLVGGRVYCSWVCPINPVTDAAFWLRTRLGLKEGLSLRRRDRLWIAAGVLLGSALFGTLAWELVNPVTALHRALVFGTAGMGVALAGAIFLFDLAVAQHGWCGHLCPVGAAYGAIGRWAPVRVSAARRDRCDECLDCYKACPEAHVIAPALRGRTKGLGPVILSQDCTNCGRCIDVCPQDVFRFDLRFRNPAETAAERASNDLRGKGEKPW